MHKILGLKPSAVRMPFKLENVTCLRRYNHPSLPVFYKEALCIQLTKSSVQQSLLCNLRIEFLSVLSTLFFLTGSYSVAQAGL